MKQKLTKKYMTVFVTSVILIVSIWILLSYLCFFGGKDVQVNEPQYLVNRFEQYTEFGDEVTINCTGKEIIKNNSLWVQIIDNRGNVLTSYNTNETIPTSYDVFKILKDSMNSNAIDHQTLFVSNFSEHGDKGVIIGCDSSRVSKYNIKITGGLENAIMKSLCMLLMIFVIIGFFAGIIYSKSISEPILNIIDNINSLERERELIDIDKRSIYFPVYESIIKLKNRLNEAKIERKKVEKQREEWIANISHDMKTPLTTIKGYTEILENEEYHVSIKEQARYLSIIKRNVIAIEDLVKDLNFSRRLKEGKITMKKERVNVCSLISDCCGDSNLKYKNRIYQRFEKEKIYIYADENCMRRVFVNIICNAFIHNNEDVQVFINCYEKDDVIVEISDNGNGMTDEETKNIFSRYYRGKSSTEIEGSGLGMAISYEIICAHKGKIEVVSEKGKGTKFTIHLPKIETTPGESI